MRVLLDTHTILWSLNGTLSKNALSIVDDVANNLYFSPVNIWEIELKQKRLKIKTEIIHKELRDLGYLEIPLTSRHILSLEELPTIHSDPFDRILLAQAYTERLLLLTADSALREYSKTLDCVLFYE